MNIWAFMDKVLTLIIKEKPELTIYVLSMSLLLCMMFFMLIIVKMIIGSQ